MILTYLENGVRNTKEVKSVTFDENCDVLSVGVGASGAYAAIAAAREGVRVIAVERDENIGGMPINGKVTFFYYGEEGGTYESVESSSTDTDKIFYGGDKHIEARQTAITEMLEKYGVRLMSGAIILGVYMEKSRVTGAVVWQNGRRVSVRCKMLIDATSDGHVVRMCPIKTYFGRVTDGKTVPFTNRTDHISASGKYFHFNGDDGYCDQYKPWEFSKKIIRAHANKLMFVRPENGNRMLSVAPTVGVREGIRYEGEEMLTYRDIMMGNTPEKVLFFARSDIDKHGHDLAMDEEEYQNWWVISNLATVTVKIPVPLGAVVPRGLDGIVTAGRCLSVDSYASSAVRMNRDMFRMGECVGIAAALAVSSGTSFSGIDYVRYCEITDKYSCRLGRCRDKFAFDHPRQHEYYRPVSFELGEGEIVDILATDSPGEAIYSCYRSGGKMAEHLIPLLASDNEMLRFNSATALGIMGRQEGLPVLREAVVKRSAETFKGCRRSNQYKSAVAICLIGRLGDKRDIETLEKIVFDEAEREKTMYAVSISPTVTESSEYRTCFYQHFTHAVMALMKLCKRYHCSDRLKHRLEELFAKGSGDTLVDYVSCGRPNGAIGEEMRDFMANVLKMF